MLNISVVGCLDTDTIDNQFLTEVEKGSVTYRLIPAACILFIGDAF